MLFLCCYALVLLAAFYGRDLIRRSAGILYALAALLAVGTAAGTALYWGDVVPVILWDPFAKGALATALFGAVMMAGALPAGSAVGRRLLSVRGELSILAGILTLGHNGAAVQGLVGLLWGAPQDRETTLLLAALCSLVLLIIMVPLWITSFRCVRRRMDGRSWKRLQRLAYGFYALTYVHVLLLYVPMAREGSGTALINVAVYSLFFLHYAALRIGKALGMKPVLPLVIALAVSAAVTVAAAPHEAPAPQPHPELEVEEIAPETPDPVPEAALTGKYRDGVYTGKGKGYAGKVEVSVTIEGGVITSIEVTKHKEDAPLLEEGGGHHRPDFRGPVH